MEQQIKKENFDKSKIADLYKDFQERFKLLATKHPKLIINTLSNIFTMRLTQIGH